MREPAGVSNSVNRQPGVNNRLHLCERKGQRGGGDRRSTPLEGFTNAHSSNARVESALGVIKRSSKGHHLIRFQGT